MRYVARKITRVNQPRPPWTWREEHRTGAPRVCLSNHKVPIYVDRSGRGLKAGTFDWMLRLYQHSGVSAQDVLQDGHVMYDWFEWDQILLSIDWLEYVDNRREVVFRMSKKEAAMTGRLLETPEGPRFAVPITAYTVHERD